MPFTEEKDAFILMAYFRSGTRNADRSWTYNFQYCIDQFVKRFNTKHCICKGKPLGRATVLNEEILVVIQVRLEQSPRKSVRKLSTQTGLSYGTCRNALKHKLHYHLNKISVFQQLYPYDFEACLQFYHWFNNNLNNDNP